MPIPERFLDELMARTDIVDLVSESVRLTKKGNSYWGCCPFHSEKTPSFHVVPDRQMYKCFGCGKGGGAINYVMELENLSFREAVEVLAKRAGMEMPEDVRGPSAGARQRREKLLAINKQAARVFHRWLYEPEGAQGLDYLRRRGLSQRTLTRFGLGFAPNRWDALIEAMAQEGYDKRDLLDAGLAVNNKDGRIYDRFRNRVMFPIIDVRGEVIGFGGRVMDDSTPKYLNSPDTPVYNKSRNVFASSPRGIWTPSPCIRRGLTARWPPWAPPSPRSTPSCSPGTSPRPLSPTTETGRASPPPSGPSPCWRRRG